MEICKKCKRQIYTREDGKEMVRFYAIYDGEYDFRDEYHKCKTITKKTKNKKNSKT